jgi:hypothetical protein
LTALTIKTARVFKPLLEPARYKGAHGGRGSGKSHFFAELGVEDNLTKPGTRGICIRQVQKSLAESAKLLIEDKIQENGLGGYFDIQRDVIRSPGDGMIAFKGMNDFTADSIKSLEAFDWAWWEEAQGATAWSLELFRPTFRKEPSKLWPAGSEMRFSWNPTSADDPVDDLLRGPEPPPGAIVVASNWRDNPWFPGSLHEERLYDLKHKPDRYGHIWDGEYEPQAAGALWTRLVFHRYRKEEAPPLKRIVVAIDPQGKTGVETSETGIVAAGYGEDGRGYILADESGDYRPEQWARRAASLYDMLEADSVICETNYGGDMVRATMLAVRGDIPVTEVRATRGKHIRAEPIAALYEMGNISHVGAYPELEGQFCLMTPVGFEGSNSPDRVDAAVWALTELFGDLTTKTAPQISREFAPKPQGACGWMA